MKGFANGTTKSVLTSTTVLSEEFNNASRGNYVPNSTPTNTPYNLTQENNVDSLTVDEFTDYMSQVAWYYVFIGIAVMISSFVQVSWYNKIMI